MEKHHNTGVKRGGVETVRGAQIGRNGKIQAEEVKNVVGARP